MKQKQKQKQTQNVKQVVNINLAKPPKKSVVEKPPVSNIPINIIRMNEPPQPLASQLFYNTPVIEPLKRIQDPSRLLNEPTAPIRSEISTQLEPTIRREMSTQIEPTIRREMSTQIEPPTRENMSTQVDAPARNSMATQVEAPFRFNTSTQIDAPTRSNMATQAELPILLPETPIRSDASTSTQVEAKKRGRKPKTEEEKAQDREIQRRKREDAKAQIEQQKMIEGLKKLEEQLGGSPDSTDEGKRTPKGKTGGGGGKPK